ncbi:EF hand family protein, putative [Babesia ovis]|uniref:ubiquitinyl hydrolase 1 n=1 Tax=Babesia ovis TaxID=5869 RepID=A0A9W5TBL9_BABOV|nr:EF hand family protein, putative [Babesia ovis]
MSWIWKDPSFMELCCDQYFAFNAGSVIPTPSISASSTLNSSTNLYQRIINKTLEKSGALVSPAMCNALLKAKEAISMIDWALWQHLYDATVHAGDGDFAMLHRFIFGLLTRLKDLPNDSWFLVPGGVKLSDETPVEWVGYAVYKLPDSSSFVFGVINTGGLGMKYHSFKLNRYTKMGQLLRDSSIMLKDVSPDRLLHSAFWFAIFRLMYAPSMQNYVYLYEVLLPYLNSKPLMLNWKLESQPQAHSDNAQEEKHKEHSVSKSAKKVLIEAFTRLSKDHKSDTTKEMQFELENNYGGVWMDAPTNEHKPSSMTSLIATFVELVLRKDEHNDLEVRMVHIMFQLSLCLLIDRDLDALSEEDHINAQLSIRSSSLFIEIACKKLAVMLAEEASYDAQKDNLIDIDSSEFSIESATAMSSLVGSTNSPFPSVAKAAGSLGLEGERLHYDASSPLKSIPELYNLAACVIGKVYGNLQAKLPPRALGMGSGSCTIDRSLCMPEPDTKLNFEFTNFGKFRLDGPNVNELAKGSVRSQLLLPVDMTSVEMPVNNFNDVCKVLRKCLEVCTLLSNQRDAISYTYAWRFQLIRHVLFDVLPLPLPIPMRNEDGTMPEPGQVLCFWANGDIELETQVDILRLLQMLARHVAVAYCSLLRTRTIEGEKAIMLGAICAIADAVIRKIAVDTPSHISLMYSGKGQGPISPFGFSLGNFGLESCYYSLTDPLAVIARTQVLDYFESVERMLGPKHIVFDWEKSLEVGAGDELLVHLVALQLGFNRNVEDVRKYFVCENKEFSAMFPEFGYLRDIVFIGKSIGWSGPMVPTARYSLEDATLKWSVTASSSSATIGVKAFGKQLKVTSIGKVRSSDEQNQTYYRKMMKWFVHSSNSKSPTSAADAHNLVTDCEVVNETDVLHLSTLPDYGGNLGRRDSELLLQYLTASYVRIPLIMQFFANEANLHAVSSAPLQKVVMASVFEPGIWKSMANDHVYPQTAPVQSPDILSTPLGLLFNEIYFSGSCVLLSVEQMLELALERDNCVFVGDASKVLPFAIRLATHVCSYVFQATCHFRFTHTASKESKPVPRITGSGWHSNVRGLKLQSEASCIELEAFQKRMKVLLVEGAKALNKRAIKAAKANDQNAAALAMAHVALVYGYIMQTEDYLAQNGQHKPENEEDIFLSLGTALIFVFVHHRFEVEKAVGGATSESTDEDDDEEPLYMPELELFGVVQNIRTRFLKYLRSKGPGCDSILEKLVHKVTQFGMSDAEVARIKMDMTTSDDWHELQFPVMSGRFTKASWVHRQFKTAKADDEDDSDYEDVLMESYYVDENLDGAANENADHAWAFDQQAKSKLENRTDDEQVEEPGKSGSKGIIGQTKTIVVDNTKKTMGMSVSLTKKVYRKLRRKGKADKLVSPIEAYEEWLKMRVMQHCDIELNFQTCELSLKKNRLQLLGQWVNQFPHYVELLGQVNRHSTVQSATVQLHHNRHWMRLVGRNYNLIRWERDTRDYLLPPKIVYKPSACHNGLEWLPPVLDPWLKEHMPKWTVYIAKTAETARLETQQDENYVRYDVNKYVINTVRLVATYQVSSHHTGEADNIDSIPVSEFHKSDFSGIKDCTLEYIPNEESTIVKLAKNTADTISSISSVITDAASSITKLGGKSKSSKSSSQQASGKHAAEVAAANNAIVTKGEESASAGSKRMVTKEIVVVKEPLAIHVFDLVEDGRTWYRSLCYSSDATRAFCTSLPRYVNITGFGSGKPQLSVGKPTQPAPQPKNSLLIIRNTAKESINIERSGICGREQFVLPECMRGLLPDVLLEEYFFWQNIKSSDIVGYPKSTTAERYAKTRLCIELVPYGMADHTYFQHSDANAIIKRVHLNAESQKETEQLVNLQTPKDELVESLTRTLLRLDDLSHILAWSYGGGNRVEVIEFAKLGLTFRATRSGGGVSGIVRYMCEEHTGLFLNYGDVWQSPLTAALIRGLENSLLLTDEDGELYILVSTVRYPMRVFPKVPTSGVMLAHEIGQILQGVAWPELIYDGGNKDWLDAIDTGSRHYMYKVHSSRSFLFVPTYASGLYLLLNRFLDRQYEQVCRISKTTLFDDESQSSEERAFWEVLAKIDSTCDKHPDAYACRLHLLLAASRQGLHVAEGIKLKPHKRLQKLQQNIKTIFGAVKQAPMPKETEVSKINWILHEELLGYVTNLRYVSAGCRLAVQDEKDLLKLCQPHFGRFPALSNRFAILNALDQSKGLNGREYTVAQKIELSLPTKPNVHNYDSRCDRSCIDKNIYVDAAANILTNVRYKKPDSILSGPESLAYIEKMFSRGVGQSDFAVVYEMLCGIFPMSTLPYEPTHEWGAVLTRFIVHKDQNTKNIMLSTLELLSADSSLGSHMPRIPPEVTQKKQFPSLFSRVHQPLQKFIGEVQRTLCQLDERGSITWPEDYKRHHKYEYVLRVNSTIPQGQTLVPWSFVHYETDYTKDVLEVAPCRLGDAVVDSGFISTMGSEVLGEVVDKRQHIEAVVISENQKRLPITLEGHWVMKYAPARQMMSRLEKDYEFYLQEEVQESQRMFTGFTREYVNEMATNSDVLAEEFRKLQALRERLLALFKSDGQFVEAGIRSSLRQANCILNNDVSNLHSHVMKCWGYIFGKLAGIECLVGLDQLVDCLVSSNGERNLLILNPFINRPQDVLCLVAAVMMAVNRRSLTAKAICQLMVVLQSLKKLSQGKVSGEALDALKVDICTASRTLSNRMNVARHYMSLVQGPNGETKGILDPRLLLFEFSGNILLHKRQVQLVRNFVQSVQKGESRCHQMIMGEGKTTVVGPLLSVLLADGERLFVQICPHALLEFTRAILRENFSAVIHKGVFTLKFSRFDRATPELYLKLLQAKQTRSVVICTPTSIKSIFLKVISCFHKLESGALVTEGTVSRINNLHQRLTKIWNMKCTSKLIPTSFSKDKSGSTKEKSSSSKDKSSSSKDKSSSSKDKQPVVVAPPKDRTKEIDDTHRAIQLELDMCLRILELFSNAIVLMDEIDLLLHPLKSELHWPIGDKKPLVHLHGSDHNIRWLLPWHILRVMVPNSKEQVSKNEIDVLERIQLCFSEGVVGCHASDSPHLVLLNHQWYVGELLPLMAEWVCLYLKKHQLVTETYQQCVEFLITGEPNASLQSVEVLNFAKEWIWSTFPHVISRVNLVNYGVLSIKQVEDILAISPNTPLSRRMLAVPFVGKGTPSKYSEFSHPDVLIGFTILAYLYQGLRKCDFVPALRHLAQQFYEEPGHIVSRQAYKTFNRWVLSAGGTLRESKRKSTRQYHYLCDINDEHIFNPVEYVDRASDIWTLDVVNVYDEEQVDILYDLLKNDGLVIEYYLCNVLLPAAMEHTTLQLTASAMELGSSMLFPIRLGFSGTPSQLLPVEMGTCHYSQGTDGMILKVLTDPTVVKGPTILKKGWTSETILDLVAKSPLKPLALIDTGALITSLSNLQVAQELLKRGLDHVDGVVYLDDHDRQMVLLRDRWRSTLLTHCGIPPERRLSFYDQVHATGQDIKQAAHATAFITIGADMTFRDYSQGAWRMRGIGKGQTLHLIIPREVETLIATDQKAEKSKIKQCVQWLVVRGITNEMKFSRVLFEQSVQNVVRKKSFQKLIQNHLSVTSGEAEGLAKCVNVFREIKDYSIPNTFGGKRTFSDRIRMFVKDHEIDEATLQPFIAVSMVPLKLTDVKQVDKPQKTKQIPTTAVGDELLDIFATQDEELEADSDYGMSYEEQVAAEAKSELYKGRRMKQDYLEMEAKPLDEEYDYDAEHEQEMEVLEEEEEEEEATHQRQQMKEEEHQTEEELPLPHRYSRSEEEIVRWNLDQLSKDPNGCGFLGCKDFYLYRKDGTQLTMPFPDYISISPNFYKIKWSANSYRRLKNVIVVLDVTGELESDILPQFQINNTTQGTAAPEVAPAQSLDVTMPRGIKRRLTRAFEILAAVPDNTVSLPMALSIIRAIDPEDPQDAELIASYIANELGKNSAGPDQPYSYQMVLNAMTSLYSINKQRRFLVVTLAEAEAIRAWLHRSHTKARIGLRNLGARFQPFDTSFAYAKTRPEKIAALVGLQPRITYACLKFFNSEMQYTSCQVMILKEVFESVSPTECLAYFQQLREMRLVVQNIKSALAGSSKLGRLFNNNASDELIMRLLNIRLHQISCERGGPRGLMASIKADKLNGQMLAGLINSNPQRLLAQPNELKDFMQYLDRDIDGVVSLADLESSFDELTDVAADLNVYWGVKFKLETHSDVRPVSKCDGFAVWMPKKLGHALGVEVRQLAHHFTFPNDLNVECPVLKCFNKSGGYSPLKKFCRLPTGYNKLWQDSVEHPRVYLWQPVAPEGYVAIGIAATRVDEEPSDRSVVCLPSKWVEEVPIADSVLECDGFGPDLEPLHIKLYVWRGAANTRSALALKGTCFALQPNLLDMMDTVPELLPLN